MFVSCFVSQCRLRVWEFAARRLCVLVAWTEPALQRVVVNVSQNELVRCMPFITGEDA